MHPKGRNRPAKQPKISHPIHFHEEPYESAFKDVKEKEAIPNPNSGLEAMELIQDLRGQSR
jgi:hypothetical protein